MCPSVETVTQTERFDIEGFVRLYQAVEKGMTPAVIEPSSRDWMRSLGFYYFARGSVASHANFAKRFGYRHSDADGYNW